MRRSLDIIGLPVISIQEGRTIGSVKSLVIDPSKGIVAAIVVDDGKWYLGAMLVPFSQISGLGEIAVTVADSNSLLSVHQIPAMEQLLAASVQIIGAKVLTKKGRIEGTVTEFTLDNSGEIVSYEVEQGKEDILHIPAHRVLTLGKDLLFISEEDSSSVAPTANHTPLNPKVLPMAPSTHEIKKPTMPETAESTKKIDDKQRKYLHGKKANKRIETENGVVIVDEGGEITEEVIQKAKLAGKFVELSMSI